MTSPAMTLLTGLVTDLDDPEELGRVRVRFPTLGDAESDWARLVVVGGGSDRGLLFRPDVGDEVLVGFQGGDMRHPVVLGGLWSRASPPPAEGSDPATVQLLRSRSGHQITLDDTHGAERLEISDGTRMLRILLDSTDGCLRLENDSGDLEIQAGAGNISVRARGAISLQAPTISVKADASLDLESLGRLRIKGAVVEIN